jgi:hypothetical protein
VELAAQTSGKIVGYVTDAQSGEALPGANLLIEDSGMGAATDANGYYIIMRVPPVNILSWRVTWGIKRCILKISKS